MPKHDTLKDQDPYNTNWKKMKIRIIIIVVVIILTVSLLYHFDIIKYFSTDNINGLKRWVNELGMMGPIVYISLIAFAAVFFLPGIPLTIIGAIIFGPLLATVYVSTGTTLGAALAFLLARYTARSFIEQLLRQNEIFRKIDEGVKEKGWKMMVITRLIPIFPYNVQNYVYGLTGIDFFTYIILTWLCMLPSIVIYVLTGGVVLKIFDKIQLYFI